MALRLLAALDIARIRLHHFKTIIVAGMGLFTDAYNFFCIIPVTILVGRLNYDQPSPPVHVQSFMVAVALLGAAIGQLVFGRLGDIVGRRRMYGLALQIMVFSSIGSGFSACTTKRCVMVSLGLFRFFLGFGIGGDYPLSATIMSEMANTRTRGAFIAGVFSMQGLGILAASTVTMVVCKIFKARQPTGAELTPKDGDIAWRLILMLGTIPAALTFYWRMMTPESARLGDIVGRRRMYGLALLIMVVSSIESGFSACTTKRCVLVSLGLFRFFLGFGIGGDYPLSATIMSEMANTRTRGAFIAGVFSMQGLGILVAFLVTMVVCKIFKARQPSGAEPTPKDADIAWRLILMLGAIPAALTFYWRMMTPESARYTALVERNVRQAAMDVEKVLELSLNELVEDEPLPESAPQYPLFSKKFFHRHGRDLFSCICSWFLIDVVFYSSSLFQPSSYKQNNRESVFEEAFESARDQAIITAWSVIPAYWFTVVFIDRIGRLKIQTMGFILLTIVYLAMGLPFDNHWKKHMGTGFTTLYGLTFFFSNFGPNTTTFIIPAELFPARFRSTCHGISGAAGKLGATIGSIGFLWALHKRNNNCCDKECYCFPTAFRTALLALAGVCAVGAVMSFLFTPETKGRSLEENEKDDEPNQLVCADALQEKASSIFSHIMNRLHQREQLAVA